MSETQKIKETFINELQQWLIEISLINDSQCCIQICIKSKSQSFLDFRGVLNETDLTFEELIPKQNIVSDLYHYLKAKNQKGEDILYFFENEKIVKIAYCNSQIKQIFSVFLDQYIDGVNQDSENVKIQKFRSTWISSHQIKNDQEMGKFQCQKQEQVEQVQTIKNKTSNFQGYEEIQSDQSETQLSAQFQESKKSVLKSDEEIQKKVCTLNKKKMKQTNQGNHDTKQMIEKHLQQYKMQELQTKIAILEKQKIQLFVKVALLQKENSYLKQTVTQYKSQTKSIDKRNSQIVQEIEVENDLQLRMKRNFSQKVQPKQIEKQPSLNSSPIKSNFSQSMMNCPQKRDQDIQRLKNKKSAQKSPLYEFFDPLTKVFDLSYQNITLKRFFQDFLPYDWSIVRRLNLDGNLIGEIGFLQLADEYLPQLREISAGYNNIRLVEDLSNFNICN